MIQKKVVRNKNHLDKLDRMNTDKLRLDVIKSFFGGITGVWHAFQEAGYIEMSRKAVEKWYERSVLPPDKFKVIMMTITSQNKTEDFFHHAAKMGITPEDLLR